MVIFFSCFYFISKICTVYQDSTFISLVVCFLSQCSFAYPNSSCYSKVYLLSILLQICLTLIVVQCFLLTHCFSFRTICITLLWNPALFVSLPPFCLPSTFFHGQGKSASLLLCVFFTLTYIYTVRTFLWIISFPK